MELGRLDQAVLGICGVVARSDFRDGRMEGLLETRVPTLFSKCEPNPFPHAFATRSSDVIAIA
jgi:hypothetical protein